MKAELPSGKDTQVSMLNDSTLLPTFGARILLLVAHPCSPFSDPLFKSCTTIPQCLKCASGGTVLARINGFCRVGAKQGRVLHVHVCQCWPAWAVS